MPRYRTRSTSRVISTPLPCVPSYSEPDGSRPVIHKSPSSLTEHVLTSLSRRTSPTPELEPKFSTRSNLPSPVPPFRPNRTSLYTHFTTRTVVTGIKFLSSCHLSGRTRLNYDRESHRDDRSLSLYSPHRGDPRGLGQDKRHYVSVKRWLLGLLWDRRTPRTVNTQRFVRLL